MEEFKRKNEALANDKDKGKGFEILDETSDDDEGSELSSEVESNDEDSDQSVDDEIGGKEQPQRMVKILDENVDMEKQPPSMSSHQATSNKKEKRKNRVYIEMELGLGVLEEKAVGSAGEGDQSDSSDEESSSGCESERSSLDDKGKSTSKS